MTETDPHLTLKEMRAAFVAAGYADSEATIRRMIDSGDFGAQGDTWYRTRGGQRRVRESAVRAVLAERASST